MAGYTDQYIKLLLGQAGTRAQNLRDIAAITANRDQTIATANARAQVANAQTWGALPTQLATIGNATARTYLEDKQAKAENEARMTAAQAAQTRANTEAAQATEAARSNKAKEDAAAVAAKQERALKLLPVLAPHIADTATGITQENWATKRGLMRNYAALIDPDEGASWFDQNVSQEYSPEAAQFVVDTASRIAKQYQPKPTGAPQKMTRVGPDGKTYEFLVDPTGQRVGDEYPQPGKETAPPQIGTVGDYLTQYAKGLGKTPEQLTKDEYGAGLEEYRNKTTRPPAAPSGMGSLYEQTDPKLIAQAIKEGRQSPIITDLSRPASAAVSTELERQGVDLAKMQSEWRSVQRFYLSKQSTQQLRIRQSADVILQSADAIDALAKEWDAGGFKALNSVTLAAAQNGVMGPDAAKIATLLQAQLTETVEAMGNVYMGGNTPTDRAMILAQQQLKANWSKDVLLAATDLVRRNTRFRLNAIDDIGPSGVNPNSPYLMPRIKTPTDVTEEAPKPVGDNGLQFSDGRVLTFKSKADRDAAMSESQQGQSGGVKILSIERVK